MTEVYHKVRAVFFDLDGTIRHSEPSSSEMFYRVAAELGLETDAALRLAGERWVYAYWAESPEFKRDLERFGSWRENAAFWENHARRHLMALGVDAARAEKLAEKITQRMREEYQPVDVVPPDVTDTLQKLRQDGYRLGLISNRSEPFHDVITDLELEGWFDPLLAAGEVGWYKPDPRLLRHAVELADVSPEEALYVGDNYHADVIGARRAGLIPVLLDPKGLFPEADCAVIRSIGEVLTLIPDGKPRLEGEPAGGSGGPAGGRRRTGD